ncbi:glycoside hydrolase family 16 protein [Hydnum rufescens UP504]|uniref:Glycoside hydrolase family 16 protein n=1 Tax=Hydnum rufescens UP504 TaxID=1448309 RepID=A0A9P6AVH1_9AGAM|nr:glycoside hydrolase family 16 protein [Hydnum rufescens UP504]
MVPHPPVPVPVPQGNTTSTTQAEYNIVDRWAGQGFFDGWDFFSNPDPTNGMVNYVTRSEATSANLAYVDGDGVAVMKVDSTKNLAQGQYRNSVRISSQKQYDGGLFILDAASIPWGWAVWGAFWTVGRDWPDHGEIDIVEGVNLASQNQMTVHSAPGCTIDTESTTPEGFKVNFRTSSITSTSCGSSPSNNGGCGFVDTNDLSFGQALNDAGGAVYAMLWTADGIKIWTFPRSDVPADITNQNPSPSTWDARYLKAAWPSSTCATKQFFQQHAITFDITLCGDWAGGVYEGGPGGSCANQVMRGSNFVDAQWRVNSVTVYQ